MFGNVCCNDPILKNWDVTKAQKKTKRNKTEKTKKSFVHISNAFQFSEIPIF